MSDEASRVPRTATGQRLAADPDFHDVGCARDDGDDCDCDMTKVVLAIEAEASRVPDATPRTTTVGLLALIIHVEECTDDLFKCETCLAVHVLDCVQPEGKKDKPHDPRAGSVRGRGLNCGSELIGAIRLARALLDAGVES